MTEKLLLETLIIGAPNWVGFIILSFNQWRIIKILLEKVNGHEEKDDEP